MTKFSIIIPVYNVEKYLDECIQSVVAQTYRNFEIVLVDDGSPDNSGAICDAWVQRDNRIRVIHQENQGLSGARNAGMQAAVGEYLLFLDSDDWWQDALVLETIADRLEKTNADVLSFSYQKIYEKRKEPSYFGDLEDAPVDMPAEVSLAYMMERGLWIACAWNKAVRRKLTETYDLTFRPGISSEDVDWSLRLSLFAQRFDYLGIAAVAYRQRNSSVSHTVSGHRVTDMCGNVEECLRLLFSGYPEKEEMLKPFVAYQYATTLFNYAALKKQDRTPELTARVKGMLHLLQWSENSKVKAMRWCSTFLGFSAMVFLLRCWEILRNIHTGGTT